MRCMAVRSIRGHRAARLEARAVAPLLRWRPVSAPSRTAMTAPVRFAIQPMERYPLLLMPISYQRPLSNDFDQRGEQAVAEMLSAHQPMLAVSTLGLPGLAVPTGLIDGVPIGVQLVAGRFQEELCLAAGVVIESDPAALTPIDPVLS